MATLPTGPNGRTILQAQNPTKISECWVNTSDYSFLADVDNDVIVMACSWVNEYCDRKFNQQTVDESFITVSNRHYNYKPYVLEVRPLVSIEDIYLQINDNFLQLDLDYVQMFPEDGMFKLLPTVEDSTEIQEFVLYADAFEQVNLWVRYTGGYESANVPVEIRYATALYAKYINGMSGSLDNIASFKTQTYSETRTKATGDGQGGMADPSPALAEIKSMLGKYRDVSIC